MVESQPVTQIDETMMKQMRTNLQVQRRIVFHGTTRKCLCFGLPGYMFDCLDLLARSHGPPMSPCPMFDLVGDAVP